MDDDDSRCSWYYCGLRNGGMACAVAQVRREGDQDSRKADMLEAEIGTPLTVSMFQSHRFCRLYSLFRVRAMRGGGEGVGGFKPDPAMCTGLKSQNSTIRSLHKEKEGK